MTKIYILNIPVIFFLINSIQNQNSPIHLLRNINSAGSKLESLIKSQRIDIAHLNNLNHYLLPEFLRILSKHRIPIIITIHDLKFICSLTSFFRNGKICEECSGGNFIRCTVNRCRRENTSKHYFVCSKLLL